MCLKGNHMEPKNGDFASLLEKGTSVPASLSKSSFEEAVEQQTPTAIQPNVPLATNMSFSSDEFSEAMLDDEKFEALAEKLRVTDAELDNMEPLSYEELERQAMQDGGTDNDVGTPE
jgi:hypothetical protein